MHFNSLIYKSINYHVWFLTEKPNIQEYDLEDYTI